MFSLETKHTLYQMKADENGVLLHLYYGPKTSEDMSYLLKRADRGFSGNPYDWQADRSYSMDTMPQEYAAGRTGDYRSPALIVSADGSSGLELRFSEGRRLTGKAKPEGLPRVRGSQDTEGLEVILRDAHRKLAVHLIYYVFEEQDVITRSARIVNERSAPVRLETAASMSIDFPCGEPSEVIHFHGRHAMERMPERCAIPSGGDLMFGSIRGMSSHHSNPYVILCNSHTTENAGECWGFMLMYSGNHLESIGRDQTGTIRLTAGIHPEGFNWKLDGGEAFQTPEMILSFSEDGLNGLSQRYHHIIRKRSSVLSGGMPADLCCLTAGKRRISILTRQA